MNVLDVIMNIVVEHQNANYVILQTQWSILSVAENAVIFGFQNVHLVIKHYVKNVLMIVMDAMRVFVKNV